jgi:predicted phage terminase large subunit-like protein
VTQTCPQSSLPSVSDQELKRLLARSSPAGLAAVHSKGRLANPPHLKLLDQKLLKFTEAVRRQENPRLMILWPPRHGKSERTSKYYPAWLIGMNPDWRALLISYASEFASTWGRKARAVLRESGGHFGVEISSEASAADSWEIKDHLGGMATAGIRAEATGKGCQVLIIDDPVKNAEEANSAIIREKNWEIYVSTHYTRLEPGGGVIVIQTPWHEDDLQGKIQANAKISGEQWDVIRMPALSEGPDIDPLRRPAGEPLWPERYGRADFDRIKAVQGSYWFSAMFQCAPQPADGGCFKRSWFRYWQSDGPDLFSLSGRPVARKHCRYFVTVDLAFSLKKEADYTVIAAWAVSPRQDLILIDLQRERLEGPQLLPQIRRMYQAHHAQYVGIEDVAAQALVIQAARQAGLTVRSLKADKDKLSRAIPATVRMEAGQIFLPDGAPWLGEYEHELLSFPRGTHDDMVDVTSYAAVEVQRFGPAAEPDSLTELREYAETELAAEFFNRAENPVFWAGDDDE